MQIVKLNEMFYLNIRIYLQLGVWGLKTSFWQLGPEDFEAIRPKPYFQFSQTMLHFIQN